MAAKLIDGLLTAAEAKGTKPRVIDISADYRYSSAGAYEAVYKHPHGAPNRIAQFSCAVPEHLGSLKTPHVAHPGCFATAVLLSSVPLLSLGLVEPRLFAAGITGSTGSGRTPGAGTHHPQRHSDLYAYNPLSHRHTPEITALAQVASQMQAEFNFVPHSGPFARGIHVTVQAKALKPIKTPELLEALRGFYGDRPFVRVVAEMPHVKDVAASNYAFISARCQWRQRRRDVRHRQSRQGRGRRRDAMVESRVRLGRNHRLDDAGGGLDLRTAAGDGCRLHSKST